MARRQVRPAGDPLRSIKKLLLSGFVLVTFALYVVFERLSKADVFAANAGASVAATSPALIMVPGGESAGAPAVRGATAAPSQGIASSYKDGTYQGPPVDAYYGLVQVQATIKGGIIKDVEFLQYPNDRRTSVQINTIAMPYLQQEAIQAQSAQVNIISGATLTSEGFAMSLQTALQSAHR